MKEIYVGNLFYEVKYEDVRELFAAYGTVYDIKLFAERAPGHPHAFAFVEMDDIAAESAIGALDGVEFMGLTLRVEAARPEARPSEQDQWHAMPHS